MNDFDEFTAGLNCTLGMMVNGKSQHPTVLDWASDLSGTYPSNELDITAMAMEVMDEFAEECNAEEELLAELQRELAGNVRAMEMCTSMAAMSAAAEQSALEVRRKAARGEAKASRAQAVTERAALGAPMESAAVNTKSTCEYQGSVRGPRVAATRLRTPYTGPLAMTKKEYGIIGILDEDGQRETVLVRWVVPHGSSWEPRGMMRDQFDREAWTSFLDAKLRKKRELEGQGIVGPYISGTELGYANPEMVLAGVHPETAAVGHPLQKVTGRRGIANAM
jgi:hypothetical protein